MYNIGNGTPVELGMCIALLEQYLGKQAKKEFYPMQPGDVPRTAADVADLVRDIGYKPSTKVEEGIRKFSEWFKDYHSALYILNSREIIPRNSYFLELE